MTNRYWMSRGEVETNILLEWAVFFFLVFMG